jgi:triacylglycerol lipase
MWHRTIRIACLLVGASLGLAGPPASAQMPPEVAAGIRALGRGIDPPRTFTIYEPFHNETDPYAGVHVERNAKYGPDPRHALDIFTPADASMRSRPVLVFLHGGGFVGGDKRVVPAIYDNIGVWAARNGMVGVNITYRLAPAHRWPAGAEDTAAALKWLRENISARGGDSMRIFLAGHSAGAVHIADYIAVTRFHPEPRRPGIRGAILISGIFDVARFPAYPFMRAYYGDDALKYTERSSQRGLLESGIPLLVAYAELDPPDFVRESQALNGALCAARRCPRFVEFSGHNHMSEVFAINTSDTAISDILLDFIKKLN